MSEFDEPTCPWCAHSRRVFPIQHEPPEQGDAATRCNLCNREYGIPQLSIQRFERERADRAARQRATRQLR